MSQKASDESAVIRKTTRDIGEPNRLLLYVYAGGRCEFEGCNKYLIKHPLTHDAGNFAQMAHIVAFKDDGPRGSGENRIPMLKKSNFSKSINTLLILFNGS